MKQKEYDLLERGGKLIKYKLMMKHKETGTWFEFHSVYCNNNESEVLDEFKNKMLLYQSIPYRIVREESKVLNEIPT